MVHGRRAAAGSAKRTRRILNVAMEYAVKHRTLHENPLPKGRGATPAQEYESPMGRRIYDIRHTRLTKWLNDGNPPGGG